MSKRSVNVLLVLCGIVALGTLVQDYRFDTLMARERTAMAVVDRELSGLAQSVSELRAAQSSYLASGQAPGTWTRRSADLLTHITQALESRKTTAGSPEAAGKYDAALQAVAGLSAIDARARASALQGELLSAADLVFIDAVGPAEALTAELQSAHVAEQRAISDRISRWSMIRLAMNAVAILLIVAVAVSFGRSMAVTTPAPPMSMAQMIRELPPPVKNGAAQIAQPAPASMSAAVLPKSPVSLPAAAELCVDLARVLDGRDVPALLERAARLLEARGIMIWSADTAGAMLRPALSHGYPEKVMARLQSLQVDSDNVTSLAYRSMQPQVLAGATPSDAGAIAIPLITAGGCVGVLAAEMKQSRPHPDLLPVARIVAAQFSTLVAPAEDGMTRSAQG